MNARTSYIARINRVIDHIDAHLAEPLDLQTLAGVAHFSPWHFHRVFQALTGETLADQVRRRRLEVAASRLLTWPPAAALDIALDVGFGSAEVFSRTFKAHFGVTPTAWRQGAFRDWFEQRRLQLSKIHQEQHKTDQAVADAFRDDARTWRSGHELPSKGPFMNVELKTWPDARVAYMRHVGPYGGTGIPRLWQRFEAWCREHNLLGRGHAVYGVSQDSPDIAAPEKCRYDACIEVDERFKPEGEVGVQTLRGGLYACGSFTGTPQTIHPAWVRLCGEWLPDSGYQPDDRPAVEAYGDDLLIDKATGAFSCLLCMPVRAA